MWGCLERRDPARTPQSTCVMLLRCRRTCLAASRPFLPTRELRLAPRHGELPDFVGRATLLPRGMCARRCRLLDAHELRAACDAAPSRVQVSRCVPYLMAQFDLGEMTNKHAIRRVLAERFNRNRGEKNPDVRAVQLLPVPRQSSSLAEMRRHKMTTAQLCYACTACARCACCELYLPISCLNVAVLPEPPCRKCACFGTVVSGQIHALQTVEMLIYKGRQELEVRSTES